MSGTHAFEPRRRRRSAPSLIGPSILHLLAYGLALLVLVPVALVITTALSPGSNVAAHVIPTSFTLHNFASVLRETNLPRLFLNSAIVSLGSTLVVLVVGSLAAYGIAQYPFPFSRVVLLVLLSGIMLAPATLIVPLYNTIRQLGLLNNYLGLIGPYAAFGLPIGTLLFRNAFLALPRELSEAAVVDGASPIAIYVRVFMPLTRPVIATVAILQLLLSWNDYLIALLVMTATQMQTVQLAYITFSTQFLTDYGSQFAVLALITVPVIVVFLVFQREFIRGLTGGAVKE
jgi:ABC-type glycerol-3-phosphate transport system permease component